MSFRNAVKYRYASALNSFSIFYIIIIALAIGEAIAVCRYRYEGDSLWLMVATAIFLFVAGLNSFKPDLKLMVQNGLTRQDSHYSFLCFIPVTVICGAINAVIFIVKNYLITKYAPLLPYSSIISGCSALSLRYTKGQLMLVDIFVPLAVYIAAMSFGYALTVLYYRMNNIGKILFSTLVPASVTLMTTMWSLSENDYPLSFMYLSSFFLGTQDGYTTYYNHIAAACIVLAVIFLSIAHLLIRRVNITK